MIKKSMFVGIVLVQGLMVFGAENNLRKSGSDLRKSSDKVSSRASSQELVKKAAVVGAAGADMWKSLDSPCGWRIAQGHPANQLAPWHNDCP